MRQFRLYSSAYALPVKNWFVYRARKIFDVEAMNIDDNDDDGKDDNDAMEETQVWEKIQYKHNLLYNENWQQYITDNFILLKNLTVKGTVDMYCTNLSTTEKK